MDELQEHIDKFAAGVLDFLKEFNEGPAFKDQLLAFVHAIDWTEPWIIGLLVFNALLLISVLLTRKQETFQFFVFIVGVLMVWCAEQINALGAVHWKSFSRQNYFDQGGLFITVMFSGPVMVICIIILVQLMLNVVQMMVRWKRAELKQRARHAARAEKDNSSSGQEKETKELKGE